MTTQEIKCLVKELVTEIATGSYDHIMSSGMNGRLSAREIQRAIEDYPGEFTMPPDAAFDQIRIYDIHDPDTHARNVELELWYDGEASDLTISAKVFQPIGAEPRIMIRDIHVL